MYLRVKFQALPDYKSQGFILCENRLRFGGEATLQNVYRKGAFCKVLGEGLTIWFRGLWTYFFSLLPLRNPNSYLIPSLVWQQRA